VAPASTGRLRARPPRRVADPGSAPSGAAPPRKPGVHPLGLGGRRDALLVVPAAVTRGQPLPLLVALHGAGGTGRHMTELLAPAASARGVLVLAPDSRGRTWDVIVGGYGPDVAFLDDALAAAFAAVPVAPDGVSVGGFSDGASYALSIGIANGDLFGHILAFSPGFMAAPVEVGRPRVYVSHGTDDAVLPIDRCSRRLVPTLRADGYDVRFDEFPGGHAVPPGIVAESFDWLLGGVSPAG
jgi:phospholipase/carboxylesterase